MTSSKKKHHPPGGAVSSTAPRSSGSAARTGRTPQAKAPQAAQSAAPSAPRISRQWVIRAVGVLAVAIGLSITLLGATPDIAGGWGKLVLMVPGMVIATGGFIAFIETTPLARSKRR